jgi:hypothetical protein
MPHTLSTNSFSGNFNTATITDDSFVTNSLVLPAVAFIILDRTKDFFTKQSIHFWLEGSVVNGLRRQYFPM